MTEHVLRIVRDDVADAFVLLHTLLNVSAKHHGSVFVSLPDEQSEVEQSRISKLRNRSGPVDKSQWQEIVAEVLLEQGSQHGQATSLNTPRKTGVELIANITDERLSIVFRRNVEGIIQRLGEIVLKKVVEQEIELFDWVQVAVKRSEGLRVELQDLQSRCNKQQQQMQKLNDQLEDFIKTKEGHETVLLGKFQRLLNEKKMKIRNQQRLLNSANVGQPQSPKPGEDQQGADPMSPNESRAGKRKAQMQVVKPESDSEDEFESLRQPLDHIESRQQTPEASDGDTTASEGSDKSSLALQRPVSRTVNEKPDPPPIRDLPFAKQASTAPQETPAKESDAIMADGVDDDDTTDDDEL